jgi:pyrroloquinoline quinone biosynthesis protein D
MSAIAPTNIPRLADKARLKWDAVREKNLLLFPEGVLVLNQTANDILALCDGHSTVADITATLVAQYQHEGIAGDVAEILQKLTDKGLVKTGG